MGLPPRAARSPSATQARPWSASIDCLLPTAALLSMALPLGTNPSTESLGTAFMRASLVPFPVSEPIYKSTSVLLVRFGGAALQLWCDAPGATPTASWHARLALRLVRVTRLLLRASWATL